MSLTSRLKAIEDRMPSRCDNCDVRMYEVIIGEPSPELRERPCLLPARCRAGVRTIIAHLPVEGEHGES
jgi:hypothetical protein